jgi:hypothetical protein
MKRRRRRRRKKKRKIVQRVKKFLCPLRLNQKILSSHIHHFPLK